MMKGLMGFFFLGAVLFSAGCCLFAKTDAHAPMLPGNVVSVDVKPSNGIRLSDISVVQEEGLLVFGGILHPRSFMQKETGHVDIRVVDSEGQLLRQLKAVPDSPVFRGKGKPLPHFSASTDLVVQKDALVHMQPHEASAESCTPPVTTR